MQLVTERRFVANLHRPLYMTDPVMATSVAMPQVRVAHLRKRGCVRHISYYHFVVEDILKGFCDFALRPFVSMLLIALSNWRPRTHRGAYSVRHLSNGPVFWICCAYTCSCPKKNISSMFCALLVRIGP